MTLRKDEPFGASLALAVAGPRALNDLAPIVSWQLARLSTRLSAPERPAGLGLLASKTDPSTAAPAGSLSSRRWGQVSLSHSLEMRPSIWVPMQAVLLAVRLKQLEGLSRASELHNDHCKEVNQTHAEQKKQE